jgi:hypothetical protein
MNEKPFYKWKKGKPTKTGESKPSTLSSRTKERIEKTRMVHERAYKKESILQ